jgi:hypothetical protein
MIKKRLKRGLAAPFQASELAPKTGLPEQVLDRNRPVVLNDHSINMK